ncbi:MAG: SIMPL domain-containing protein [Candidatus Pacebacteria bacterium]|nr:SIMPL domain-containing protein [Candidatus Paceibacterota bacterium]
MNTFIEKNSKLLLLVGLLLAVFLLGSSIKAFREARFAGSGLNATNTIIVSGKGEVEKSPDTAKVSFSVRVEKKDLKAGQDEVSGKIDTIKKELIALGVEEKYIKTNSYTSYPQYDYPQSRCYTANCPVVSPVLRGYEVNHSVTVSIKDLSQVDGVLGLLAKNTVTDMSGPNFGFEDDKVIAREARDLAIADAKSEAEKLAKSLGVKLVRMVSFSENGGGYPAPMYARDSMATGAMMKESSNPVIPVGDQKVESNVTIVYEIR